MIEQDASMKNTKKEMLNIIQSFQKEIEEREKTKLQNRSGKKRKILRQ